MTREEAIDYNKNLRMYMKLSDKNQPCKFLEGNYIALDMAIKSLEAWDIIKDNLSQQVHHNLDVKENFEIGSTSRIECNTTASVLSGVIYLIDRYLVEVEK